MTAKPRILVFTNVYLPGYLAGGPVRSISSLVEKLADEFQMQVVTADRDFGSPVAYADIERGAWNKIGRAQVYYLTPDEYYSATKALMRRTPHDLVYLNSFFSFRFSIIPLLINAWSGLRQPVLLAPRGEFAVDAYRLKAWKKRPYLILSKLFGLYRRVHWHASTGQEAADIRARFGSIDNIFVARNLSNVVRPATADPSRSPSLVLRICFLARISRMKNLEFALEVVGRLKVPARFDIFGPQEDAGYWRECETLIAAMPPNVEVRSLGPVAPDQVHDAVAGHDVFFVPSRGENFGHGFLEALSAGVPILVSDRTPWRNLRAAGVGWDIPLDEAPQFVEALEELSTWSEDRRKDTAARCRQFAHAHATDTEASEANRRMFRSVISGSGTLPAGAQFHEQLAEGWSGAHERGSFKRRLALFRTILDQTVRSGQSWLDLGCGAGVLTRELLARGARVVAFDGSPAMLREAQRFVGERQPAPVWIEGDVQQLTGLGDGAFDGVLCSSVVEYVAQPEQVLREIARVLRPGGTLVLSLPPTGSALRVAQRALRVAARCVGRQAFAYLDVSRFEIKPARLDAWLGSVGLVQDQLMRFDPVLPPAVTAWLRPALLIVQAHKRSAP